MTNHCSSDVFGLQRLNLRMFAHSSHGLTVTCFHTITRTSIQVLTSVLNLEWTALKYKLSATRPARFLRVNIEHLYQEANICGSRHTLPHTVISLTTVFHCILSHLPSLLLPFGPHACSPCLSLISDSPLVLSSTLLWLFTALYLSLRLILLLLILACSRSPVSLPPLSLSPSSLSFTLPLSLFLIHLNHVFLNT